MPGANAVSFLKDYQPKKHSKDEGRHAIQAVNSNIVNQNSIWRQHIGKEEKIINFDAKYQFHANSSTFSTRLARADVSHHTVMLVMCSRLPPCRMCWRGLSERLSRPPLSALPPLAHAFSSSLGTL